MTPLEKSKQSPSVNDNKSISEQLREYLLSNPLDHLPSLFLLAVAAFGIVTLFSLFFIDMLAFPFVLIAIFTCLFAAWHIRLLGSMKVQVERLTEENEKFIASNASFVEKIEQFETENKRLSANLTSMEASADALKQNNDLLHQQLTALQTLRSNLQDYADETKLDFSQLLEEVNQNFKHLEVISIANERVLLQRIAQDLEFLDHEAGMQADEYKRFIQRIPEHLQDSFARLGDTSFEHISGDNKRVDHQEVLALVHQLIKKV
jgi:septal ring factor EnvC (AmiA/AmiB activator)